MSGREEMRAAIAAGLRKCRVEDGAPMRLIREADVLHISHMVAEELEALMTPARDHAGSRAFTLNLIGDCIYCGKKATRSRTFYARNQEDAAAQAKAAMSGHCHRKCAADHAADLYSMAGSRVCCCDCPEPGSKPTLPEIGYQR